MPFHFYEIEFIETKKDYFLLYFKVRSPHFRVDPVTSGQI